MLRGMRGGKVDRGGRGEGGGSGGGRGRNTDQTDPFARLEQTHRRLEERLSDLCCAVAELSDPGARSDALALIAETVGFFARGGGRHVEDEERTLFPRIRHLGELSAVLARLEEEHRQHQSIERELGALVDRIQENGLDPSEVPRLVEVSRKLDQLYREHIAREERDLFPPLRRLLDPGTVEEMGREMMERRPHRGKDEH
jgi:hemerythrin-like domain-containing protein